MVRERASEIRASEAALWFGLWGGAVAWTLHLLGIYAAGEFGCIAGLGERRLLGLSGVSWLVLAVSAATGLLAAWATLVAYRHERRARVPAGADGVDTEDAVVFMARAGWICSGTFLFIILVETIPIFYFLRSC